MEISNEETLLEELGIDVRYVNADYRGDKLRKFPDGSFEDEWGVRRKAVDFGCRSSAISGHNGV